MDRTRIGEATFLQITEFIHTGIKQHSDTTPEGSLYFIFPGYAKMDGTEMGLQFTPPPSFTGQWLSLRVGPQCCMYRCLIM
jgi:hypothetical protein